VNERRQEKNELKTKNFSVIALREPERTPVPARDFAFSWNSATKSCLATISATKPV
jgi:hypothetical protein